MTWIWIVLSLYEMYQYFYFPQETDLQNVCESSFPARIRYWCWSSPPPQYASDRRTKPGGFQIWNPDPANLLTQSTQYSGSCQLWFPLPDRHVEKTFKDFTLFRPSTLLKTYKSLTGQRANINNFSLLWCNKYFNVLQRGEREISTWASSPIAENLTKEYG